MEEKKDEVSRPGQDFESFDKNGVKGIDRVADFAQCLIKGLEKERSDNE